MNNYDFLVNTHQNPSLVSLTPVTDKAIDYLHELVPDLSKGESFIHTYPDTCLLIDTFIPSEFSISWLPPLNVLREIQSTIQFTLSQQLQEQASNQSNSEQVIGLPESTSS